jgi:phytoene dehydrogenase-like protein
MSRIVVIGGGLGGMASAARLAKLGHSVTLLEATPALGGAIQTVSHRGFEWDTGPTSTLLPAVLRDLFRKTGRPLERELDLVSVEPIRHVFADGSEVCVPGGSRAAQIHALEALGEGLGASWAAYVEEYSEMWEWLRRDYFERPFDQRLASRELRTLLGSRESLNHRVATRLADPRLRVLAEHAVRQQGHDPARAPAWTGIDSYLVQRFGEWAVTGGFSALTVALVSRLQTRGVTVLTDTPAVDLLVRRGRAQGVITASGEIGAEVVICAIDPSRLPQLRRHVRGLRATIPPAVTHIAFSGDPLPFSSECVFHGDFPLVLRPGRTSEAGHTMTLLTRTTRDPVADLALRGVDLRERIIARLDRSPQLVGANGSSYGVEWRGRGTVRRRWGPDTPLPGVLMAGAHANPGAGVHLVGLSAALVAQAIGPSR